jgi:hypothetical protein
MVALWSTCCHEYVAALVESVGDEELQFACLVSTGSQPGAVIPLDPEAAGREAEGRSEAIGSLQAGGQVGEIQFRHGQIVYRPSAVSNSETTLKVKTYREPGAVWAPGGQAPRPRRSGTDRVRIGVFGDGSRRRDSTRRRDQHGRGAIVCVDPSL